jgi:hypothetical protein
MSSIVSGFRRPVTDHFEPQDSLSLQDQKRLRGQLEHIDYTAFASNKEMIAQIVGTADAEKFAHLAVAVARARAEWVAEALGSAAGGRSPSEDQVARLRRLRMTFEELSEAYDGLRRMVERGYLPFQAA